MDSEYDYEDIRELQTDIYAKRFQTPHQVMEHNFYTVHNRNWKTYLQSIPWDSTWLKHDTPEEVEQRIREIQERKRIAELKHHPFKKWF